MDERDDNKSKQKIVKTGDIMQYDDKRRTISKITAIVIIMAICTVYALVANVGKNDKGFTSVTNEEACGLMTQYGDSMAIVDVRTPEEFAEGHIGQSINMDVKNDSFDIRIKTLENCPAILIYCRSGRRSKTAAEKAAKALPATKIYELDRGYNGWE